MMRYWFEILTLRLSPASRRGCGPPVGLHMLSSHQWNICHKFKLLIHDDPLDQQRKAANLSSRHMWDRIGQQSSNSCLRWDTEYSSHYVLSDRRETDINQKQHIRKHWFPLGLSLLTIWRGSKNVQVVTLKGPLSNLVYRWHDIQERDETIIIQMEAGESEISWLSVLSIDPQNTDEVTIHVKTDFRKRKGMRFHPLLWCTF